MTTCSAVDDADGCLVTTDGCLVTTLTACCCAGSPSGRPGAVPEALRAGLVLCRKPFGLAWCRAGSPSGWSGAVSEALRAGLVLCRKQLEAARAYEDFFGGDFGPWAGRLLDRAAGPGDPQTPPRSVLDLACGTGIIPVGAAARCPRAHIVGLDLDPGMIGVARQLAPAIT